MVEVACLLFLNLRKYDKKQGVSLVLRRSLLIEFRRSEMIAAQKLMFILPVPPAQNLM